MITRHSEFLHGIKDELPILIGVLPFGMIYGVTALSAGIPAPLAQAMSCIVFAGSAQFVIAQLIAASTRHHPDSCVETNRKQGGKDASQMASCPHKPREREKGTEACKNQQ